MAPHLPLSCRLIPPGRILAELCLNALSLRGSYLPRSLRRALPKHSTRHMQEELMIGAMRTSTLQPSTVGPRSPQRSVRQELPMSSGARTRRVLLLAALLVALCTNPLHAQQTRDRWPAFRLLAQQELQLAQPQEEGLRLPALKVFAPARLPVSLLPLSSFPGAIQIIPGDEIPQSGTPNIQEYLTRLPGVALVPFRVTQSSFCI